MKVKFVCSLLLICILASKSSSKRVKTDEFSTKDSYEKNPESDSGSLETLESNDRSSDESLSNKNQSSSSENDSNYSLSNYDSRESSEDDSNDESSYQAYDTSEQNSKEDSEKDDDDDEPPGSFFKPMYSEDESTELDRVSQKNLMAIVQDIGLDKISIEDNLPTDSSVQDPDTTSTDAEEITSNLLQATKLSFNSILDLLKEAQSKSSKQITDIVNDTKLLPNSAKIIIENIIKQSGKIIENVIEKSGKIIGRSIDAFTKMSIKLMKKNIDAVKKVMQCAKDDGKKIPKTVARNPFDVLIKCVIKTANDIMKQIKKILRSAMDLIKTVTSTPKNISDCLKKSSSSRLIGWIKSIECLTMLVTSKALQRAKCVTDFSTGVTMLSTNISMMDKTYATCIAMKTAGMIAQFVKSGLDITACVL